MKELPKVENVNNKQRLEQHEIKLNSLAGFSRLSENQKRYILNSFHVQERAERGSDIVSASRIQEIPKKFQQFAPDGVYITTSNLPIGIEFGTNKEDREKYLSSQRYIMKEFCHSVINKLEEYRKGELNNSEWYENGPITSYPELEKLITLFEEHHNVPFLIQVCKKEIKNETFNKIIHSTLLLGTNGKNELMVWEKSGFNMPFQLVNLKDVYLAYEKFTEWRLRPLSV